MVQSECIAIRVVGRESLAAGRRRKGGREARVRVNTLPLDRVIVLMDGRGGTHELISHPDASPFVCGLEERHESMGSRVPRELRHSARRHRLAFPSSVHSPPLSLRRKKSSRHYSLSQAMPSTSTLTSAEKSAVKKYAPTAHHDKIHAAAIGRVYYAYPDPAKWSYSGIAGAVVFGWGDNGGWIKVVDLAGTRGVIWQHAVVQDMPYYQDRTFFHTFPSDVSSSFRRVQQGPVLWAGRLNPVTAAARPRTA